MAVTPLLEQVIKQVQKISDMDILLKRFNNKVMMDTPEKIEQGLIPYDSIPGDTCYIFPFID